MLRGLLLAACCLAAASAQPPADPWTALRTLAGKWSAEGGGTPGAGAGEFSFTPDLQDKILVRRSFAQYPATKDRPAFRHDDLMVIYGAPEPRAVFFDSEGHVIHYRIQAGGDSIVFTSDPEPSAPRFRLTYSKIAGDRLRLKFEIAPPGKPDSFSPYIEATAKRVGSAPGR